MSQEPISLIGVIIYSCSAYSLSTYRIPTIKRGAEDNEQKNASQSSRKVEQFNAQKEIHDLCNYLANEALKMSIPHMKKVSLFQHK